MIYYKLLQITNIVKGSKQIVFYKVVSGFLGEIVNYCFCKNYLNTYLNLLAFSESNKQFQI